MNDESELYNKLKNLAVPEFENKEHQDKLRKTLYSKIYTINAHKTEGKKFFFKSSYSYVSAFTLTCIVIFSFIFLINQRWQKSIISLNGIVTIEKNGKEKVVTSEKNISLNNGDIIKTSNGSYLNIKISENSILKIEENTSLKINNLEKFNNKEINKIYLAQGKIDCAVKLPSKDSCFQIITDLSVITTKGTKFSIEINKNGDLNLNVFEGIVEVGNFIKSEFEISGIKTKDEEIYNSINDFTNSKILVNYNNSLTLNKYEVQNLNKNFNEVIKKIANITDKRDSINKFEKIKILNEIKRFNTKNLLITKGKELSSDLQSSFSATNSFFSRLSSSSPEFNINKNDIVYSSFENPIEEKSNSSVWAWNSDDKLRLSENNEPVLESKHSLRFEVLQYPKWKGLDGPYWRGFGLGSQTNLWDFDINPEDKNNTLILWIYALPINEGNNNLNVQFYDNNKHNKDKTKIEYWTKDKAKYGEWTKIRVPFKDLLAKAKDLDLHHINKLQIQIYWPGIYYFDYIASTNE